MNNNMIKNKKEILENAENFKNAGKDLTMERVEEEIFKVLRSTKEGDEKDQLFTIYCWYKEILEGKDFRVELAAIELRLL